jgi:hypothetical protein
MAARTRAADRDRATESDLSLPAEIISPGETSRFERLRGRLFNHGVGPLQ